MRILFLLPCATTAPRGNAVTAARLAAGLERIGHRCERIGVDDPPPHRAPDLWVALHALRCGPRAAALRARLGGRLVVLYTGTDLRGDVLPVAHAAVAAADACVALGEAPAARARRFFPECATKLRVIPQAVLPLPESAEETVPPAPTGEERILLPSGIRMVKAPWEAVEALAPLAAERPGLRLRILGPELELEAGKRLRACLGEHSYACWLGAVSRTELGAELRAARVVLSASLAEGGPPNALLEAAAAGIPVLARDIPVHREFPGPDSLWKDPSALRAALLPMLDDPERAREKGAALRERVLREHDPQREAAAWSALLQELA